jgi:hypothetical protein
MNAKLLEKIEVLTLLVIALEKLVKKHGRFLGSKAKIGVRFCLSIVGKSN